MAPKEKLRKERWPFLLVIDRRLRLPGGFQDYGWSRDFLSCPASRNPGSDCVARAAPGQGVKQIAWRLGPDGIALVVPRPSVNRIAQRLGPDWIARVVPRPSVNQIVWRLGSDWIARTEQGKGVNQIAQRPGSDWVACAAHKQGAKRVARRTCVKRGLKRAEFRHEQRLSRKPSTQFET